MSAGRPIEIVGGGLAGLSLGLALARRHVPVTIFEAGDYPRHRVCGEFIAGLDDGTLQTLGLAPHLSDALRHQEVAFFRRGRFVRDARLPRPALGLSRYVLDARLARAFTEAGGILKTSVRMPLEPPRVGRVDATGRRRGRADWLGLKFHIAHMRLARDLELHLGDDAYVGLASVAADTVNVCGLFRRRSEVAASRQERPAAAGLFRRYLLAADLEALALRIDEGAIDPGSICAVAALDFSPPPRAPDRIALGDALAMIPPFTGNGMAIAFQGAACALGPLEQYSRGEAGWREVCAATDAALRSRFTRRFTAARRLHPLLLRSGPQRWIAALGRARLLPFRPLFALVHGV